jgi:FkbM family methyltransferase
MILRTNTDGFKWIVDVADGGIGRQIYASSTPGKEHSFARENMFMTLLDNTIKPGMTCIDVGANIGYATLFMTRNVGDSGTVYAIEPDPHNAKFLLANLKENEYNCEVNRCLISDHDGQSDFWIARHPNLNSVKKTKHSIRKETIKCLSLNTFCSTRKYPNFLKMDLEGHEVSVFEGGYEYFKNNDGETHFLLEVHPQYYDYHNDFATTLKKYEGIGFKVKYVVATPVPDPEPLKSRGYSPIIRIPSDGFTRSLYQIENNDDAIFLACNLHDTVPGKKVIRSIMVSRE